MLGSVQTDQFCWNPAEVGISYNWSIAKIDMSTNQIISKEFLSTEIPLPGSDFDTGHIFDSSEWITNENGKAYLNIKNFEGITEWNCPHCKIHSEDRTKEFQDLFPDQGYTKVNTTYIEPDCGNALLTQNSGSYTSRLNGLKLEAAQLLNFNIADYDELLVIFGKLGNILPSESERNFKFRCSNAIGFIGGWSDLTFAENFLLKGDFFIGCASRGWGGFAFYENTGWHALVHEFLHEAGAVDIYNTGTILGYESPAYNRAKALEIDPLADESIMGNEDRACKKLAEITENDECNKTELERVYLDKYNKGLLTIN
jgi:hypothetical protein